MNKCVIDIKKDIIDEVGTTLTGKGAYVEGNVGYFPSPNKATAAINEVNRSFNDIVVKQGEQGAFTIDPSDSLSQKYLDEYNSIQANPTVKRVYQGYNTLEDREFNYYTLNPEEAKSYGKNVREVEVDTKGYMEAYSDEYYQALEDFRKISSDNFDLLDNSPKGLATQTRFFNLVRAKGYKGINFAKFDDSQYLVSFAPAKSPTQGLLFQLSDSGQKFTEDLKNKLLDFLKGLNIDVQFNADEILNSREFQRAPLAAFDVLQKFMAFGAGQEKLLPRQVAAAVYTFLGKKSSLSKGLWANIELWEGYKEAYERYNQNRVQEEEEFGYGYMEEDSLLETAFNPFAHKMAIIEFLEQSIMQAAAGKKAIIKRNNEDITASYFKNRGRLNVYEGNALEKIFKQIYNWFLEVLSQPLFDKYDSKILSDLGIDIAEDVLKGDFNKFIRGLEVRDGKLYKGEEELELKTYNETLDKDPTAKKLIMDLVNNPFVNFKLSGSLILRKYGDVFREKSEDLHDIDGVITLETFRQDPLAFPFKRWIDEKGLKLLATKQFKEFNKQITKWIEQLNWYTNVKQMYPDFRITNVFIGKDNKSGESVTVQGEVKIGETTYKLDFFLRTGGGNYLEIFDNYWKDWKQIFEAKLNMGRAKDLADLVYFSPILDDKYKFTNKGFRFFAFAENQPSATQSQIDNLPMSTANASTLKKVKEMAAKMGISIESLVEYAKKTGLDTKTINGVADLVKGIIAIAEGKEGVTLTEEMVHIATAILEQTNPRLVTEMIAKIERFKIYQETFKAYKDNKNYQLPNGKPDIRKIKKEAVDKLLAEYIINGEEGSTEYPELREEVNTTMLERWWNNILDWFRGMYRKSNSDIFESVAAKIINEEFGTVDNITRTDTFYQITPEQQKILDKLQFTKDNIEKVPEEQSKVDPLLMDTEEATNFYKIKDAQGNWERIKHRVTDRVKIWYKRHFGKKEFTEAEKKFNELKRTYGIEGHKDFEEIHSRYYNDDGTKRSTPLDRPASYNLPTRAMYIKLETYYTDLINLLPEGTIIKSEVIIYSKKDKEAGTIDFLAIEPDGTAHILDWKFMKVSEQSEDIAWFKQGAFDVQLGRYKQILIDDYGIKKFGWIRAIPILMDFGRIEKKNPDSELKLKGLTIGSANADNIEDLRLLPVSEKTETTGFKQLDTLIAKLNALYAQIGKEQATDEESREFKKDRLNTIKRAVRLLQGNKNIAPLIAVIEVLRKDGQAILNDYNASYKNRPATKADSTDKELSAFSDEMNQFIELADIFADTGHKLAKLIYDEDMLKSAKTKEEREHVKAMKKVKEDLDREIADIFETKEDIKEAAKEFAKKHIGERNLVAGLELPEAVVKGLSSLFRGVSELPLRSLQILYKLVRIAQGKAKQDALESVSTIMDIRNRIAEKHGDIREYISILFQKDDKGGFVNKLIHQFKTEFYTGLDELVEKDVTSKVKKEYLKDNVDLDAYNEEARKKIEESISWINTKNYAGTKEEVKEIRERLIENVKRTYDIDHNGFNGWNNYILKRHPLPKWYSDIYRTIKEDSKYAEAFEMYNFIKKYNEKANSIGYIDSMVTKTFLPFVRKSGSERMAWGDNKLEVISDWINSLQLRADDVGYGQFNEITGALENSIPKYFVNDFSRTEEGINDYTDVSEDLFKNMILYVQQVERYKYMSEIEGQLKLVKTVETYKNHLQTDRWSNVVPKKGQDEPEQIKGNEENVKIYDQFLRTLLYGQKYVLTDSDTPLHFDKITKFFKTTINKLANKEVFDVNEEETPTSMVKLMDAANRGFQLKTLGLSLPVGIINWFGSNIQLATQSGNYFLAREVVKNEGVIFKNILSSNEETKTFAQLVNLFMPLADDPAYEEFKKAGMSKLTRGSASDFIMLFMRKPEQLVEKSIFLTLLENTMVENGKLVNIREFVKKKYADRYENAAAYKSSKKKIEEEIKQLKQSRSIATTRKMVNGKLEIPGLDLSNKDELLRLTELTRRISRNALGGISDGDLNRMSMSIWTKSMMVFKTWIPKLTDTRFSELRKVSDDFSVEVGEDGFTGDKYDIGRIRLLSYVLTNWITSKGNSIIDIVSLTDKGIESLDALYEHYAKRYKQRTGEDFTMSRADFNDMIVNNLRRQLRELALLGALLGLLFSSGYMAPDDDEDRATKNAFRYYQKILDKFVGELSFFYNPLNIESILSGSIFPAIGLVADFMRFVTHLQMEITGIDITNPTKDYDEVVKQAKPMKYLAKMLPGTKEALVYGAILSDDFARGWDITIPKENR
jgi:hypothetical protein